MKTLHLLRHAKSSWDNPELSDRERGLNHRGQRDAPLMGAALSELIEPVAIRVSPARRARLTLEGICSTWPDMAEMEHAIEDDLYTFSSEELLTWIRGQDDALQTLFIIGHNPALTDLVNTLLGEFTLVNLPTAGYVQLSLDIARWDQLLQCVAVLDHSLFPKQLK